MKIFIVLLLLLISTNRGYADGDVCDPDEYEKVVKPQLLKVKKLGSTVEAFLVHFQVTRNGCIDKLVIQNSQNEMKRIGIELAQAAEKKGDFYSDLQIRSGKASAFQWYSELADFKNADRMILAALKKTPPSLSALKRAQDLDGENDRMNAVPPYLTSSAFKKERDLLGKAHTDRLMKEEEKSASNIQNVPLTSVAVTAVPSLQLLREAISWMNFLPGGIKPAQDRALKRGDQISARGDVSLIGNLAVDYYRLAGSEKAEQQKAKMAKAEKRIEKSAIDLKKSFKEKSSSDSESFKKGADDLEKDLDF